MASSSRVNGSRVNVRSADTESDSALAVLNASAIRAATDAGLSALLIELVQLRASQINGCAFCLRVHTRKALESGESTDRLGILPAWRETDYFDEVERAALDLTESLTLIADGRVSDELYLRVSAILTEQQVAAVTWLGVAINAYNRAIIASRVTVAP